MRTKKQKIDAGKLLFSNHDLKVLLIPLMVEQLLNSLMGTVDSMMVSNVGSAAISAVSLVDSINVLVIQVFTALTAGGAIICSQYLGRKDVKACNKAARQVLLSMLVISIGLMAVCIAFRHPLLRLIFGNVEQDVMDNSQIYFLITALSFPFIGLFDANAAFFRAEGNSRLPMTISALCNLVNIAGNAVLIFGFHMGVQGAALATILSQLAGAIWVLRFMTSPKTSLRLKSDCIRPDLKLVGSIMALGVSPFIMQSTESLISVVMSSGLQRYGNDVYVGSLTILQSIMQLTSTPINGFTQGVQPILSYNFGAGKLNRVKQAYRRIIAVTAGFSFLLTALEMMFPKVLARMFTQDEELIALVGHAAPIFLAGMLIFGIQMGCQTTFMGLGQAKISLFMALLRKVFLLVPFALIFPMVTGKADSIYFAECTADALAATICGTVFALKIRKILKKKIS